MDRRQAEESLARALREQDTIFSANPDIIYVTDMQACLLKWNKSLETATGYPSSEIIMKKFASIVPPNEADLVTSSFARLPSEGKCEMEIHLLTKSGALIPYHFNSVPLHNQQGQIIGFTGTGRDITERKQGEARLKKIYEQLIHSEKLSALGKLTGSIAHEFNNPIYGLRNIIEQTREEEGLDAEIKSLLDLAVRECDRMAGLVRKLQGFYKPTDDTKSNVDIHQVLDDIEALAKKKMKVKGINLIKNYCPDLPTIYIVEDQVKQVLLNLINNAEEAISDNGEITISTEFNDAYIKVRVQDTGEGIPQENLKLIFEPFFSTKGIKGTGLGLSVCYGLVNAHGGNIEVASKPGEGSTFTLSLPIGEV
jgi:PAS domain S-box-containing protein